MMKHFVIEFKNGKKYMVHGNKHTEARKEARRLFPNLKDIEIVGSFLI